MAFPENVLMCMKKEAKLINYDCLPILTLLYVMLAFLMLLAALSNVVCLHNAFLAIDFYICCLFSCLENFED